MASIQPEAWGIPSISINGFSGFGDNSEGPYTNRNKVFEVIDNVSWIRGRHSFKGGGSLRIDHYNQVGNQFPRGSFQLNGSGRITARRSQRGADREAPLVGDLAELVCRSSENTGPTGWHIAGSRGVLVVDDFYQKETS